jgi:hypothetical protein
MTTATSTTNNSSTPTQTTLRSGSYADNLLHIRGILFAARLMHWFVQGMFWRYPVYDMSGAIVAYRKKALDSNASPKYLWDGTKGQAKYYHSPKILAAVSAANGVLYIANGEPSVLAYHAAGIENVLSWFGENAVPATLARDLHKMGVRYVIYAPDADDAGLSSAAKVRDLLAGSGIHFEAHDLSGVVPAKGDFNDVWINVGFDAALAKNKLDALPILTPNQPSPLAPLPRGEGNFSPPLYGVERGSGGEDKLRRGSGGEDKLRRGQGAEDKLRRGQAGEVKRGKLNRERLLLDVLAYFMALPGWKKSGAGYAGKSPFRDDKKSSAGITEYGMFQDFASGEKLGLLEVAAKIGLDVAAYREQGHGSRINTNLTRNPPSPLAPLPRGEGNFSPPLYEMALPCDERSRGSGGEDKLRRGQGSEVKTNQSSQQADIRSANPPLQTPSLYKEGKLSPPRLQERGSGGEVSWWHTAHMPRYWRSACLQVLDASATLFIEKLHHAIIAGKINSTDFTVSQAAEITGISEQVSRRAINAGLDLFFQKVGKEKDPISLYPKAEKNSGRTEIRYQIRADFGTLHLLMLDALKKVLLAKYHTETLAALQPCMLEEDLAGDSLPIGRNEFKELAAGIADLQTDADKLVDRRYRAEFEGDHHGWHGWAKALEDDGDLKIKLPENCTPAEYRALILRAIVAKDPDKRHHRQDLARILGVTDSALDNIYKRANLQPIAQYESVVLKDASPEGIAQTSRAAQTKYRGKVLFLQDAAGKRYHTSEQRDDVATAARSGKVLNLVLRVPSVLVEKVLTPKSPLHSVERGLENGAVLPPPRLQERGQGGEVKAERGQGGEVQGVR